MHVFKNDLTHMRLILIICSKRRRSSGLFFINFTLCRPISHLATNKQVFYSLCAQASVTRKDLDHCKFRNFGENFILANSVKRHSCDIKNSQLGHDLSTSVNDRVILPFREGFIFAKK